jgi:hypothetical protein
MDDVGKAVWSILWQFCLFNGIKPILCTAIWSNLSHFLSILRPFGIFCGYLVYVFYGNLVYFPRFGMVYQGTSGNLDLSGGYRITTTFQTRGRFFTKNWQQ